MSVPKIYNNYSNFATLFCKKGAYIMKKTISILLCAVLVISVAAGLSGCSGKTEMTDENITAAVETAQSALKEFDTDELSKYVDSKTLGIIIPFAEKKEAFRTLGKAMFENLSMEIVSIDAEKGTVTLSVINKDLSLEASAFAYDLKYNYSTTQLLTLLDNDDFINENLGTLIEKIGQAKMQEKPTEITLTVKQGKKNLMLVFDDESENAVSGGALGSITSAFGV